MHANLPSGPLICPLYDWQAGCRNIEDKNQILSELEHGVGSVECNRLVVGLMRKALDDQAQAVLGRLPASEQRQS